MSRSFAFTFTLVLTLLVGARDTAFAQAAAQPEREDPNQTRLLFGPTGRSLEQGEVSVGVYEVLLPFVQVGITDRLSIGAGTPLLFGDFERLYWFTPKLKVLQRGSTAASVGAMHFLNVGDDANIGIAYGVVTHGGSDAAITVGGGYAYARWQADKYQADDNAGAAVAMLAGERRVGSGIKLVTENYAFKGGGFISGGVRFFGEKLSADLGLMMPLFDNSNIVLPVVNIVRKF